MAGVISVAVYLCIYRFILKAKMPFEAGLTALPIIWGVVLFVNVLSITLDGSKLLYLDVLTWWHSLLISFGVAIITMIVVHFWVVPWQKNKILNAEPYPIDRKPANIMNVETGISKSDLTINTVHTSVDSVVPITAEAKEDEKRVNLLFHFVQILAAIFSSFAHGGNDVANSVGPLIAIWLIYTQGIVNSKSETPILLLAYGGVGMVLGLWLLGRRVIDTVGFKLTKITPATGVTIESGAAATVLMASKIGIPISTTHCKVGAVAFVGWVYGKTFASEEKSDHVNWKLFGGILAAWVITLPAAGAISAFFMWIFQFLL